jgi:CPA1 family monovalent cation:H+ antiporter
MDHLEPVLLSVLLAVAGLLLLAHRSSVPYPILFVLGGAALGFVPGLPRVEIEPEVVLVLFLPPLLYSAAFFSSLRDLRANVRPISLLAVGLVITTMVVVAVVAHAVVDGLSWPAAFVLGAVVSPTDPIAATSIASRLGAPRRYVTIVEGESLVNDATALVAYKYAVAALVSGSFSLAEASASFVAAAIGGIAIGLAVAWVVARIREPLDDPPTEISISILTPFVAYLPAELAGASAVLAAVTSGVYLGWHSPRLISPSTRIQAFAVWEILVFVLNSALFVLVGLSLSSVLDGISGISPGMLALYAAAVSGAVILTRIAWVFPFTYLPRMLSRRLRTADPSPPWAFPAITAWTGMRGGVSLAAALAIPLQTDAGAPVESRDLIIFLTYAVILSTLVLQGLSLPWLIRRLGLQGTEEDRGELEARVLAAKAALRRIEELREADWVRPETADRMRGLYEFRIRRFKSRFDDDDDGAIEAGSQAYQRLRRQVLEAERQEVVRLRNEGRIDEQAMRRVERDLDLEDTRLDFQE